MPFLLPAAATAVAAAAPAAAAAATTAAATAGITATLTSVATNILMNVAISAVMSALQPQVGAAGRTFEWTLDPDGPIPFAAGRIGVAGSAVYRETFGPDLMYYGIPSVISGAGPIDGFESFLADDESVTFDGTGKAVSSQYAGELWYKTSLGTQPATAMTSPSGLKSGAALPGWTSAHKLSGKASYMIVMGENSKGTAFPTGEIKPLVTVRGLKGWDPRFDSTYPGGSGACRLNDPSTWVYLANPILWALKWSLGLWEGPTGKGAPQVDYQVGGIGAKLSGIDVPAFVAAANVADANGWTVAAYPTTDDDKAQVLDAFLQAGGATYAQRAGKISCIQRAAPRTSIVTISGRDTAGPLEIDTAASRIDRINTIRPRYWSEAHRWQLTALPEVTASAYQTQDGGKRTRGIDYPYVPNPVQAAQLAALQIANTREGIAGVIPLKPHLQRIRPGDAFTITEEDFVLNGVKCLCLNTDYDPATGIVRVSFVSETDAKYPFALGQSPDVPVPPVLTPVDTRYVGGPLPGDWVVTPRPPATGGTQLPGFDLTGLVSNATATAILVEYGPSATGPWKQAYQGPPTVTNIPIDGVQPGAIYYIAVSYQRGQNFSQREVYGPYTAPGLVAGDVLPSSPTIADINARYDDLIDAYGDTVAAEASASAAAASAAAAAADRAAADLALGGAEASELAAAGSASIASSKADEAAGSAEASSASATAAQASNSASGGSAAASAASAATASAKATEAGTSAAAAQADRIGAQTANSNAGIARDAAVAAQSGAAGSQSAAAQSATLAARVGVGGGLYANNSPSFSLGYNTSSSLPTGGWEDWSYGWDNTQVAGQVSDRAIRFVVPAGRPTGLYTASNGTPAFRGAVGPGWWVMEYVVTLESGSLDGAGGYLATTGGGSPLDGDQILPFVNSPDSSGVAPGNGVPGKTYSFARLFQLGNLATDRLVLYVMANWDAAAASSMAAKTIIYHFAGVRRATAAEIETGVARNGYASVSARISAEESVRASETAALASRVSATEAIARTGANLVVNSSGVQGMRGWTPYGVPTLFADPWSDDGPRFITGVPAGTTGNFYMESDFFVAYGGNQYSMQGEIYRGGQTTGETRIYVQWMTAGNVVTGYQVLSAYSDVYWQKYTSQGFVAPPNTAKGLIYCDCINPTFPGGGTVGFRRMKLESGALCTAWTDEAAAASLSARTSITETSVADAQSKLAVARLVLLAEATGGRPARFGLQSDSFGGSFASIDAAKIYFGDNTVFDDVSDTLQTVTGSVRRVIAWGSTFGPDGLFEWVGDSSVALSAMTRANAQFFMASTSPYIGGAAITPAVETGFVLAGSASPLQTAVGATSVTVSAAVTGATGTVFYRWSQTGGDAATISNANIVNPTISVADNTGKVVQLQCQISDDQKTRTKYLRVFFRSNV